VIRYESATRATGSLFCKYSAARSAAYGHRGGLLYEADVYRHVLAAAIVPVPKLVSAGGDDHRGSWLMLSFLDNAERLSEAYGHMVDAAAWLGRFHSQQSGRLHDPELAFLNRYDEEYYRGWADRTVLFARQRPQRVPWLEPLSEHYQAMVPTLTAAPQTVIHGEFTIHNTMVQDGCIYPTDWETAAIASGDIDLMCLVDAWPSDVVSACIAAYTAARGPGGSPPGRDEQLIAAELYLHFRWLGESPRLMVGKKRIWRFGRLQALAERLGVPA
jgi:aminoglycoside phosphotransferase (APT) family kinase protein